MVPADNAHWHDNLRPDIRHDALNVLVVDNSADQSVVKAHWVRTGAVSLQDHFARQMDFLDVWMREAQA